ncbi:MAG: hypothetical protein O4859_18800, partial [Trichodesmium sp. St18_bin1]|nr:hypothetical protein [Trichodesmium sp. St18_bin1]
SFGELIPNIRKIVDQYHLRLELVEYPNQQALEWGLLTKEVHAICSKPGELELEDKPIYHTAIRVHRLFEIIEKELTSPEVTVRYINIPNLELEETY